MCIEAKEWGDDHIAAWGDGSPIREFLYVADAAEGIVLAAERYNASDPVDPSAWLRAYPEPVEGTGGQPRRKLDMSKAERYLGFKSKTAFEEGLQETIERYQDTLTQPKALTFALIDI